MKIRDPTMGKKWNVSKQVFFVLLTVPLMVTIFCRLIIANRGQALIANKMSTATVKNQGTKMGKHHAYPQVFLRQSQPIPPRANGTLRLVFLSDTHGRHDQIPLPLPDGDVLFHLGDAANRGNISDVQSFAKWLEKNSFHNEKIVIDGNHDQCLTNPELDLMKEYDGVARVLKDEVIQVANGKLTIVGLSWNSSDFDDYSATEASVKKMKNEAGEEHTNNTQVDLVLSHMYPYVKGGGKGWHGSKGLTNFVGNLNAPLHCFGHIHWTRGVRMLDSGTTLVNCASTWNEVVVIDYNPSSKRVAMVHCPFSEDELENSIRKNSYLKEWLTDD